MDHHGFAGNRADSTVAQKAIDRRDIAQWPQGFFHWSGLRFDLMKYLINSPVSRK
jgi:hypothetical protein